MSQQSQVNEAEVVAFFTGAAVRVAHNAVAMAADRGAYILETEAKEVVSSPPPSHQGSPPARRTGKLRMGLMGQFSIGEDRASIKLATTQIYGAYLDEGFIHHWTGKWIKRPFSILSIAQTVQRLRELMPEFLATALREETGSV